MSVHRRRGLVTAAALAAVLVVVGGCTPARHRSAAQPTSPTGDIIVVASFNFPESTLLAEIYAQALENAGLPVRREFALGPRELVQPALRQGLVDVVPEYLGAALASLAPHADVRWSDPTAGLAALRARLTPLHLQPLRPSPATDQNSFAVTQATARRLDLHTLTELARVRPPLVLGGPSECPQRPDCLAGLRRVYGLKIKKFVAIDDAAQRAAALDEGMIDVAVTFTTDGRVAAGSFVLLRDDRGLQPAENVVPVVSARVIHRYGTRLVDRLDRVSAALDTAALRFLNWRVSVNGQPYRAEARGWLRRHDLLTGR